MLKSFSVEKAKASRDWEPEGFTYGYEPVPNLNNEEKIYFTLMYPFPEMRATAIEENDECFFTQ